MSTEDPEFETLPESELRHPVRRLELEDIADVKQPDASEVQIIRDYLSQFCAKVHDPEEANKPVEERHEVCPSCGKQFTGLLANLGLGVGVEWGLVHGEGHCSKCRYPYRGHHRIYDLADILESGHPREGVEPILVMSNFFLAYHPSQLSRKRKTSS